MKLGSKNYAPTSSTDNLIKTSARDEFKQRSFKNSQYLREYMNTTTRSSRPTTSMQSSAVSNSSTSSFLKEQNYRIPLSNITPLTNPNSMNGSASFDLKKDVSEPKSSRKQNLENSNHHVSFSSKLNKPSSTKTQTNSFSHIDDDLFSFSDQKSEMNSICEKMDNIPETPCINSIIPTNNTAQNNGYSCIKEDVSIIAKLEKKNLILMSDLRENCQLLSALQKRLDESTNDIVNKSNEIVKLKTQLQEVHDKKPTFSFKETQCSSSNENNDQNCSNNETPNDKVSQGNEDIIRDLEKQICEIKESNNNYKQQIIDLQTESSSLKVKVKDVDEQNAKLLNEVEDYKKEIEELMIQETENDHCSELSEMISSLKNQNINLTQKVEKLKADNESFINLIEENNSLKKEIQQYKEDSISKDEVHNNLLHQISLLKSQNEDLSTENQKLINHISDLSKEDNESEVSQEDENKIEFEDQDIDKEENTPNNFVDDFESNSYLSSEFSSDFFYTDTERSPKMTIIQQLIAVNKKNKKLSETNAKLETAATESLSKIRSLEEKNSLSINDCICSYESSNNYEIEMKEQEKKLEQMRKGLLISLNEMNRKQTEIFNVEIDKIGKKFDSILSFPESK